LVPRTADLAQLATSFDRLADITSPARADPVTPEGWAKWNRHYFLRDWPGFVEFFFTQTFTEPHSTKQIEDAIGWGLQTDPQINAARPASAPESVAAGRDRSMSRPSALVRCRPASP